MTLQAYLDAVKAKTDRTPDDFRKVAAKRGLTKFADIQKWLKAEFGLGHGHAGAIAHLLANADKIAAAPADKLAAHFKGDKAKWRGAYDGLAAKLTKLGEDVTLAPNQSYINVQRGAKKFGIVQISSAERMDLGVKLKGAAATDRLEVAGAWNAMVTHRVRIGDSKQIDKQVLTWFKQAFEAAGSTKPKRA